MTLLKPRISDVKPMKVVYIRVIENYGGSKMQEAWPKLFDFIKKNRLFSFGMYVIGVCYDDPSITEPEKCRYDACISIKKEAKPEEEIGVQTIEGGKFAVFKHKGPYEKLNEVYDGIYNNWLPSSGHELRDVPSYEKYLNNPERAKPEKLKTHIYIPVK